MYCLWMYLLIYSILTVLLIQNSGGGVDWPQPVTVVCGGNVQNTILFVMPNNNKAGSDYIRLY